MPSRLTAFQGCVGAALVAATIVMPGRSAHAQSLEPRSYVNTPTGINFLLLGYGYTQGEVGFDASTPITDARVHVHAGVLACARSLDLIPAITFFTNNDDFLRGKTLEQDPIYSLQGHLIYEFSRALWAAFDATYYTGGRTTIDGEKGERLENVRLGLTTALSVRRHQSIKLFGSAGVYNRTENNFWAVGLAWQFRWGGRL